MPPIPCGQSTPACALVRKGEPFRGGQCRFCWLALHDRRYRELWGLLTEEDKNSPVEEPISQILTEADIRARRQASKPRTSFDQLATQKRH